MAKNINDKKVLAEKLKTKLNDPVYTAVPKLPIGDNHYGSLLAFVGREKSKSFVDIHDDDAFIMNRAEQRKNGGLIYYHDLESSDWEEIVKLIQQKNEEKRQNYLARKKEIEATLDSQPGLYYLYTKSKRLSFSYFDYPDKQGKYFGICGKENGRTFWLNINASHPVLNDFKWQSHGYYLIKTDKSIERNDRFGRPWSDRGEENENNFHKWVEVDDKITITPYEVDNDSESLKKPREKCDVCQKGWEYNDPDNWYLGKRYHGQNDGKIIFVHSVCYPTNEKKYLENYEVFYRNYYNKNTVNYEHIKRNEKDCYASHKDQNGNILQQQNCSHCQPWKPNQNSNLNVSESDLQALIQYLQKNSIKEINFKNNELVITHNNNNNNNNNEIISTEKINDKPELVSARNIFQKSNQPKLTKEDLEKMLKDNSVSTQNPKGDHSLMVGCLIGAGLILAFGIMIMRLVRRNKNKKNK